MKSFNNLMINSKIGVILLLCAILYSFYYLFKNYQTIELQLKVIIYFLILGFTYGIYNTIVSNNNFNRLINDYSLTTGKVTQYFVPKLKGGLASRGISSSTNYIKYTYMVELNKVENYYDFNSYVDIPDFKPNLNVHYLVIYESRNAKNSFILLDYPIFSNGDLERYKSLFKHEIPKNIFKTN